MKHISLKISNGRKVSYRSLTLKNFVSSLLSRDDKLLSFCKFCASVSSPARHDNMKFSHISAANIKESKSKLYKKVYPDTHEQPISETNDDSVDSIGLQQTSTISKAKMDKILETVEEESQERKESILDHATKIDPTNLHQIYYFDTLAFVKNLEKHGFSRQQAEGIAECLSGVVNTTLDHQGRHMVTKAQQEVAVQRLMSEIVSVKKDMTILQRSEFSTLKSDTEKMAIELQRVQGHLCDQIVKQKGQFTLDINLERGRSIEAHAANERDLQKLNNKIETEIANLKTTYEQYRNDVFKYAGGTMIGVATLIVGILRLWL